jgi:hypothetical protein
MTESQLDQILGAWFDEGVPTAPDRLAENAMAEIAIVPQERDWPDMLRSSFSNAPLAWAAGILALAVGIGILIGPRLIGGPTPIPSPSPTPDASATETDSPSGTLYRNVIDGYELLVPSDWEAADRPDVLGELPGVLRFDGRTTMGETVGALTISIGSTDGSVYECTGLCVQREAHTLDELGNAIQSLGSAISGDTPFSEHTDIVTLGGELARFEYPVAPSVSGNMMGFPGWCSVYAFHEDRPVILSFVCNHMVGGTPAGHGMREAIIDSFRFLDEPAPSPDADAGWQELIFPEAGFAASVQDGWSVDNFGDPYVHSTWGPSGGLIIRSGDEQNRIRPLLRVEGPPEVAASIEDLIDLVTREFLDLRFLTEAPQILTSEIEIDGTPARRVALAPAGVITGPGRAFGATQHHVLAVHNGRPFVITWTGSDGYERTFRDILERFRFLD